jgi:hypothetical protein
MITVASVTFTQSPLAGNLIATGHNATHIVTITATDGNGNSTPHIVTLTAKDVTAPAITGMPANISVSNDAGVCGASVTWESLLQLIIAAARTSRALPDKQAVQYSRSAPR